MFGLSMEHLLILGIILLIFGPRRLPELGMTLGKAMRNFKDAMNGVQEPEYRKLDDKNNPPVQSQIAAQSQTQNTTPNASPIPQTNLPPGEPKADSQNQPKV